MNGIISWGFHGDQLLTLTGAFHYRGITPNGWFIRESPIKLGMIYGGTPVSGNLHMDISHPSDLDRLV